MVLKYHHSILYPFHIHIILSLRNDLLQGMNLNTIMKVDGKQSNFHAFFYSVHPRCAITPSFVRIDVKNTVKDEPLKKVKGTDETTRHGLMRALGTHCGRYYHTNYFIVLDSFLFHFFLPLKLIMPVFGHKTSHLDVCSKSGECTRLLEINTYTLCSGLILVGNGNRR